MKMTPVLVAIAADRDLRLLRAHAAGQAPEALAAISAADFADVDVDFPAGRGRGQSGGGGGPHGYGAHHSEAEMERARFARHAAKAIAAEAAAGAALLLVAGPKMLGVLRKELAALGVEAAAEIDKDLVKLPAHDLPAHLDATLRRMATGG